MDGWGWGTVHKRKAVNSRFRIRERRGKKDLASEHPIWNILFLIYVSKEFARLARDSLFSSPYSR